MSQIYTTRRRAVRDAGKAAAPARETRQETYYGGFSETDGGMGSQLGELMQARMRQHFLDHQNPAAEREADQLSAGLDSARTPEEVKSRLGERLGADFSGVRFHTDAGAVGTAEAMGPAPMPRDGTSTSARGALTPLWRPTSWSIRFSRGSSAAVAVNGGLGAGGADQQGRGGGGDHAGGRKPGVQVPNDDGRTGGAGGPEGASGPGSRPPLKCSYGSENAWEVPLSSGVLLPGCPPRKFTGLGFIE